MEISSLKKYNIGKNSKIVIRGTFDITSTIRNTFLIFLFPLKKIVDCVTRVYRRNWNLSTGALLNYGNFDVHSIGSFSKPRLKRAGRKRIEHFSFNFPPSQLLLGLGNLFLLRKRDSIEILGRTATWNEDTNVNSVNYSF